MTTSAETKIGISSEHKQQLFSRFLINIPAPEQTDSNRLMYHLESAYFFFIDHLSKSKESVVDGSMPVSKVVVDAKPINPEHEFNAVVDFLTSLLVVPKPKEQQPSYKNKSMTEKQPSLTLLQHAESYSRTDIAQWYQEYLQYKYSTPGAGMVVFSKQFVLMIKSGNNKWSLPKGKINCGERFVDCAVRELKEETGLELKADRVKRWYVLVQHKFNKNVRHEFFSYRDDKLVEKHPQFKTPSPYEIRDVAWIRTDDPIFRTKRVTLMSKLILHRKQFIPTGQDRMPSGSSQA